MSLVAATRTSKKLKVSGQSNPIVQELLILCLMPLPLPFAQVLAFSCLEQASSIVLMASPCACNENFAVEHALQCSIEGYTQM